MNLCDAQKCPENEKLCTNKTELGTNFCCGNDEECSIQHPLVDDNPKIDKSVPVCARKENKCKISEGERKCPENPKKNQYGEGEVLCCKKGEECVALSKVVDVVPLLFTPTVSIYICAKTQANCKENERICSGAGQYSSIRKCCSEKEICDIRGQRPYCIPPVPVKIADGKQAGITGSVINSEQGNGKMILNTNETGIYFLNSKDEINSEGEVYYIYSENGSIDEVMRFIFDNPKNLNLYGYGGEVFGSCDKKVISGEKFFTATNKTVHLEKLKIDCNDVEEIQTANLIRGLDAVVRGSKSRLFFTEPGSNRIIAIRDAILRWRINSVEKGSSAGIGEILRKLKELFKS